MAVASEETCRSVVMDSKKSFGGTINEVGSSETVVGA
jgi:hypothetical protein